MIKKIISGLLLLSGLGVVILVLAALSQNILGISLGANSLPSIVVNFFLLCPPIFIISGTVLVLTIMAQESKSWLKFIGIIILGIIATYIASLPILFGGLK